VTKTVTKKRAKTQCLWCRERITPQARGRTPRYCSASCRQRAYEARKLKLVYEQSHSGLLKRLNADLDHAKLRMMVHRILVDIGLIRPEPLRPMRHKPHLTVVQEDSDELNR
jgi:hypothetical protein